MKTYIETKTESTKLKIEVYYHLGGYSYFTCKTQLRGYYLSVSPVQIQDLGNGFQSETYTAFTGSKMLLLKTERKSQKSYNEAVKKAETEKQKLIELVASQNNLIL